MPNHHFLSTQDSLSRQVAAFLPESIGQGTLLVTPTAGATRSVASLAGLSSKQARCVRQPMQALLPAADNLASPVERSLAWAEALNHAQASTLQTLFWKRSPERTADRLKAARNFIRLTDLLAEGGLSPKTVSVETDANRWAAIKELYGAYLEQLSGWNLAEPNELRFQQIKNPPAEIERIIVAGIPDLPQAFSRFASALESKGTQVDVLIWNPGNRPEDHFDDWGRPLPDIWKSREVPVSDNQLHVAASAQDESRSAIAHLMKNNSALVSIDPGQQSLLSSEILAQGLRPYLPEGDALIRCEGAKLVLEWDEFLKSKDLRRLRRLLELPAFCRALDPEHPITQTDALAAIDHLLGETIASTLDGAWAASPALPEDAHPKDKSIRGHVRRILGTIRSLERSSAFELLGRAFTGSVDEQPETIRRILEIGKALENSPAIQGGTAPTQILAQAIRAENIQSPAPDSAITINGWLEAPWLGDAAIVLCGCIEGRLPQSVDGDAFLPDSLRPAFGLGHNDQRLARDAYLLDALLASRPPENIRLSFSKYNREGDPNRPSRLLLRTPDNELPERVRKVTSPSGDSRTRPRRQTNWRWRLPGPLPKPERISPTSFGAYLACPFRFCLDRVLHLESGPQPAREMDAAVFGNLIHKILENFSHEIIPGGRAMLRLDQTHIQQRVQALMQEEALRLFGPKPTPAVQIQLANASTRLNAFARAQADCFADGWQIIDAERRLQATGEDALHIGPLALSGMIDRIDKNIETGALRIMDYKTFSTRKSPAKAHFGPAPHNWMAAAEVELAGQTKSWINLQLPLYRRILEHWYPEETAEHATQTAYFVLPSDPNETGIDTFVELDSEGIYESALACAEAVAKQIHEGIYWPPQPFRGSWDDPIAPLLVNGPPEDCIAPDTIDQLTGGAC